MHEAIWIGLASGYIFTLLIQRHLLSPTAVFAGYSAIGLPVAYLVSHSMGTPSVFYAEPALIPTERTDAAFIACAVGLLGLIIGRYSLPTPKIRWSTRKIVPARINGLLAVSLVAFIFAGSTLVSELGGIERIINELGAVRSGELKGQGLLVYTITMLVPTALQFKMIDSVQRELPSANKWLIASILSSLLGASFGFRGPAVALVIQSLAIYYLLTGRPSKKLTILILFLSIPVVTMLGFIRILANETASDFVKNSDGAQVFGYMIDSGLTRVRGVETFSLMYEKMKSTPFHFFERNLFEAMVSPFPSALIDKGTSLTEQIATAVYGNFLFDAGIQKDIYGGVSYTFISEGYWNLGYVGVLIYGVAIGWFFSAVESRSRMKPAPITQIIIYKATAGFCLLLVEATQLGINAIIVNSLMNMMIFYALTAKFFSMKDPPCSATS